jgi:two-component system response regulator HydG
VSSILVIDDHDTMRDGVAQTLMRMGHSVATAKSGEEGVNTFEQGKFDCAITDLRMAGMDGVAVVRELRKRDPDVVVLVMTAFGTVETAVSAMKEGAYDFVEKPIKPELLRASVERGLELVKLRRESAILRARTEALEADRDRSLGPLSLLGESEPMQRLKSAIGRVAATDATVLVHGESGTGKELVARAIHEQSARNAGPFVAVHCAALAETLLESELFGHERGSFTGATRRKLGRFELAEGGTLFLDEVGEIPLSMQSKLLRVLQQKEIQRVGGEETLKVDVRLVSATHRDLKAEVQRGTFREDLYYRLHIVPLELPPLRERPRDIALLAEHFVAKHGPRIRRSGLRFSNEALEVLSRYNWPGNVRELENAVEQALVFCEGDEITISALPAFLQQRTEGSGASGTNGHPNLAVPDGPIDLNKVLEDLERQLIARAFEKAKGVKTETARLLGIKTSALYYKLQKYGFISSDGSSDEGPASPSAS